MTLGQQPEALRLANALAYCDSSVASQAAAELRRLHAENVTLQQGYDAARLEIDSLQARVQELGAMLRENRSKRIVELEAQLEAIGAGGVEPLRPRKCLHQIAEPAPRRAGWLEQLGFELREHGGVRIVVDDCGHEREATLAERVLWDALLDADGKKAAPAAVEVPSGWRINGSRRDGRIWLTISTPNGASASLSAAENTENEDDTIVAQVLDFLADSLAAPTTHAAPAAQGDAEDAARYQWLRKNWFTMSSNYQRGITFRVGEPRWSDITEAELDAAIDAALSAQGGKKGGNDAK